MFIPVKLSVRAVFVNNLNRHNKSAKESDIDYYIQVPFQPQANLPNQTCTEFSRTEVKCSKIKHYQSCFVQTREDLYPASKITSRKLTCTRTMCVRLESGLSQSLFAISIHADHN